MYCQVNGVSLYYEVSGEGSPLLMIHGNSESHEIFDAAIPQLSRTHRVYAVDSRCHGKSTKTERIGYDVMASDLIALIHALGLHKPLFYGFSDGGILGLLIAIREPELLGKLIVSGANLNPKGLDLRTRLETLAVALTGNRLFRMMLREPDISLCDLHRIAVPTVVLAGEHDVVRRAHTELIAESIPGAVLEILPGEDHGSYIVHSEKLAKILRKYL